MSAKLIRPFFTKCITASVLALVLSGCANKLPGPEANAFRTIADANTGVFIELDEQRLAAQTMYAKRAILVGEGRVVVEAGCDARATSACVVTYTLTGTDGVKLGQSAVNARKYLGSLSRYAEQMADLAEAKDLDTVNTNAQKAAGSAVSLFNVIAPGADFLKPVIDLAMMAFKASLREKRRLALLEIASKADPSVQRAVGLLNAMLKPMISDIELNANQQLLDVQGRMARLQQQEGALVKLRAPTAADIAKLGQLRQQRADLLDVLVATAGRLNAVREIDLDFSTLGNSHKKLLDKLEDPDADSQELFENLNQILVLIDELKAATQKEN